ncbi:unnamed protein product [Effrenium voratum]|uniref:Uncharacterized protein n=1 Tax=Effrenium voratum TaxID=2562239 RepID=A0AA36JQD6_9DINO|nr:unnamed protein product [Effrenium voratum]
MDTDSDQLHRVLHLRRALKWKKMSCGESPATSATWTSVTWTSVTWTSVTLTSVTLAPTRTTDTSTTLSSTTITTTTVTTQTLPTPPPTRTFTSTTLTSTTFTSAAVAPAPRVVPGVAFAPDTSTSTSTELRAAEGTAEFAPEVGVTMELANLDYQKLSSASRDQQNEVVEGLQQTLAWRAGLRQGPEISPMARFACLVWLTVLSRGVSAEDVDECAEGAEMRMLQVGKATLKSADLQNCGHLTQDTCYEGANFVCSNNCPIHTHGKDCYRPIPEVMAEHPGMDGYCYFNMTGFWVVPVAAENPDFVQSSRLGVLGLRCSDYPGLSNGPPRSLHFEGEVLTTHMDCPHYIYDDLYGYSLGQLQGQGVDPAWMKEPQHWMAVSEKICQDIQKTWNFTNDELHLADWLDDNAVIYVKTACAANSEPGSSDPVVLETRTFLF